MAAGTFLLRSRNRTVVGYSKIVKVKFDDVQRSKIDHRTAEMGHSRQNKAIDFESAFTSTRTLRCIAARWLAELLGWRGLAQQLRQLGEVHRHAAGLVPAVVVQSK